MRTLRVIPEEFADILRGLHAQPGQQARLNYLLLLLREAGWTNGECGRPLGCSYQAIQQRVRKARPCGQVPDIPVPPPRAVSQTVLKREAAQAARAARSRLDGDLVETLREMYAVARTVNGRTPIGHPSRQVSEEFTALLGQLRAEGRNMAEVARRIGTSYQTIRMRLARHGYKHNPPSQAVYTGRPIPGTRTMEAGLSTAGQAQGGEGR